MRIYITLISLLFVLSAKAQNAWINYSVSNTPLPENSIRSIRFENDSTVWVGTDAGLARLQGTNWYVYTTTTSGIPDNDVRCITIGKDNIKWIGTFNGGFASLNDTTWANFSSHNSPLIDDFVRSFAVDNSKTKWIGAGGGGGLTQLDTSNTWTNYQMFTSPLESNNIASVFVDTTNNIKYIGTVNGGLSMITDTSFTTYTIQTSGIPDNTILGITKDNLQNIWLASPGNGLIVKLPAFGWFNYSPFNSNIASYGLTSIDIDSNYDLWIGSFDEGLIHRHGNNFENFNTINSDLTDDHIQCITVAPDGKIWMGTATAGIFVLDPSLLTGIEENNIAANVDVYPNPATKGFTHLQSKIICEAVSVYDLNGKIISLQIINATDANIDLRNIKPGIYFLQMKMKNGSLTTRKIIVSN